VENAEGKTDGVERRKWMGGIEWEQTKGTKKGNGPI
jgi:hypothetical protein